MSKKIYQLYKWSAIINIAVAAIAGIITGYGMIAPYLYFPMLEGETFIVGALTVLVCAPMGIWHWRKYKNETETKTFAVWGIICGLFMLAGILFPPILFLAILACPFGVFYAGKYIVNANEISAPIFGGVFGVLILFFAVASTGGHSSGLFYWFTAPFGGLGFPWIFLLVPLWWALLFFLAVRPTTGARLCFIAGECIHFLVAIFSLTKSSAYSHSSNDFPFILILFFIYMIPYIFGHVYAIRLMLRSRDSSNW